MLSALAHEDLKHLPKTLMECPDDDPIWEEVTLPGLIDQFSTQRRFVSQKIIEALEAGSMKIEIDTADGETWYGALNQARLGLEETYQLKSYRGIHISKIEDEVISFAITRNALYGCIQTAILEEVMIA